MAHATAEEYEDYTGESPPADIGLRLTRASRLVNRATITAQYDVDENDIATDPKILTAFREATIEQVAAWVTSGTEDGTGAAPVYQDVQIGSVRLGRGATSGGAAGGGSAADRLAPQARMVLEEAGLLGQAPRTYPARCP
ncbi:hypothetical protein [Streptosporangium sp. NPDC006930]|uniref:hypothetical protein n=1 Tax=Streptosporangium sp. NPDC006930 TaxID=3154783 RepID=UPI00342D517E